MLFPRIGRHTLSMARGDAGGEKVLTFRRDDDGAELGYNIAVGVNLLARNVARNWVLYLCQLAYLVVWWTFWRTGSLSWSLALIWTTVILAAAIGGLVAWRLRWPGRFETSIGADLRRWHRYRTVYFKPWQSTMQILGMVEEYAGVPFHPKVFNTTSTPYVDTLDVEPCNGQATIDFEQRREHLADTFGAERCRVRQFKHTKRRLIRKTTRTCVHLDFVHVDVLADEVPALPIPDRVDDYRRLPIGRLESGAPWLFNLLTHTFVGGLTRAGKSSLIWSIMRAIAPAIRDNLVLVWGIDPKRVELVMGAPLFARLENGDEDARAQLLVDAVTFMAGRAGRYEAKGVRKFEGPTEEEPALLVVVDEGAWMTKYDTDNPRRKVVDSCMQKLLSQGAGLGVYVLYAVQDPSKEVCSYRHMFPDAVALRLKEARQVEMVLDSTARERGAECDKISPTMQGTAYFLLDGEREPGYGRAGHVTDDHLREMAARYSPRTIYKPTVSVPSNDRSQVAAP